MLQFIDCIRIKVMTNIFKFKESLSNSEILIVHTAMAARDGEHILRRAVTLCAADIRDFLANTIAIHFTGNLTSWKILLTPSIL